MAFGDLNRDGWLDLVVTSVDAAESPTTAETSVLMGAGDGTLLARTTYPAAIGDVNGDSWPDVVVGAWANDASGTVSVLLGLGGGALATKTDYPVADAKDLALHDLNGDGRLDLVAGGYDVVGVLLGGGDGTFASRLDFSTGSLSNLAIGDVTATADRTWLSQSTWARPRCCSIPHVNT